MTVEAFCRAILEEGSLAAKLAPPPPGLSDRPPAGAAPRPPDRPARDGRLDLAERVERLPAVRDLGRPDARAVCLARFAHHELMAVELFAWALLAFPRAPRGLRRGLLQVLAEEQRHCRLYLGRLRAHGDSLEDHALSGYFWRHLPAIAASPHGPRAFLCAMGLTFEQANLDFAPLYADGFRDAGDDASARVCEVVHADEVRHVRLAAVWNRRLAGRGPDEIRAYTEAVPFPLGAARAKGRRFQAAARRSAGLSEPFIEHVRTARSTQQAGRRGP